MVPTLVYVRADPLLAAASQLTRSRAEEFYVEHFGKSFFDGLVEFMSSGPVVALVLSKQGAITGWRGLMGPTNSLSAREQAPRR